MTQRPAATRARKPVGIFQAINGVMQSLIASRNSHRDQIAALDERVQLLEAKLNPAAPPPQQRRRGG